ncbi:MAG: type II secretory ATPase GspE/PulE/Tfp pilus assembly ATPase PilB-like protein [Planctomycetota bacterium]|jgi:type II secretory ATPase GspE/PulE/Tfp pilus assembly ATPase PilB-like protein
MSILDVLTEKGVINPYDVDEILGKAKEHGDDLYAGLLDQGVPSTAVVAAASEYYAVPPMSVAPTDISPDVFRFIPEESAHHYRMLPVRIDAAGTLEVAMVDPGNMPAKSVLEFIFNEQGVSFFISVISLEDFQKAITGYSGFSASINPEGTGSAGENDSVQSLEDLLSRQEKQSEEDDANEERIIESAPVTKMVAAILMRAIEEGVSDIHIERSEHSSKVRYRLDGVLTVALTLPRSIHNAIVARVKILAKLKLDEKRKPQDGRFPARVHNRNIDFRVSTMPTFFGEKAVIRILDPHKGVNTLTDTGMSPAHIEMVQRALAKPYGIILITGPTGSGKSTTLYSMLEQVDRIGKNVISLEDPIEYNIEGVSQSQVHPEIGYDFATGLRSILRQDPDVIMVGEIRDKETAQLAIQAALTGHMVFSTLHTNNSIGVIPRLIDMGVDPYLIAPTLSLAMAQRLVRKICPGAEVPMPIEGSIEAMIQKQFADLPDEFRSQLDLTGSIHDSQPTANCPSGTKGRTAVFEMFEVDKEIERIILTDPTEQPIYEAARKKGMITMKEDAFMKSKEGLIPFREVNTL